MICFCSVKFSVNIPALVPRNPLFLTNIGPGQGANYRATWGQMIDKNYQVTFRMITQRKISNDI